MTRTLVVSHFFPPEPLGGAHRWKKLVNALPDDQECRVVSPHPSFPYGEFERTWSPISHEKIDGVRVTRLWTYQPRSDSTSEESNLGRILNYLIFTSLASIYLLINVREYDCVVTVSAPHTTFLPGVVGKLLGLTWVADIFDLWLDNAEDMGYVESGTVAHRFVAGLERRAISDSDHVLVITETMREHYVEKYSVPPDKFTLVPFGVDDEMFAPRTSSPESSTVVYTGNMGEAHALRPFIRAFHQLDGVAELRLVGTGKRRDELEALCEDEQLTDHVTFVGPVPREEIPQVLGSAACSIVPLQQGHNLDYARPTKLLESMALGTPYVASSLSEIERVTEETKAGFAVQNEPDDVASAIRTLVEDDDLRTEMGTRGVEFIDAEHRWPKLAERVDAVLEKSEGEAGEDPTT